MKMTDFMRRIILSMFAFLFLFSISYGQSCPSGLISYWKMDENEGLTLYDFSGGHNATCNVALAVDNDGAVGAGHYFDYSNTATVPGNSDYDFPAGSSFSIEYWMKFTEVDYGGQDHIIFSKGDWRGGDPSGAYWSSGVNGSGKVNFIINDSYENYDELESTDQYNDGEWHHVVAINDGDNDIISLYVDGESVESKTRNFTGSFTASTNIAIGYLLNGGNPEYFYKGSVDEVAIYNKALTTTDIINHLNNGKSGIGICDGGNPKIFSSPVIKASVGNPYTYNVDASGKQDDMQYSLVTRPDGMTINPSTGLISWTPSDILIDARVSVVANNGIFPADTQRFVIYISDNPACTEGLLVLLKLNETSGPVYYDYFNQHNSTATNMPVAISGIIDGAQEFGSNTKLDIPDKGSEFDWIPPESFSIEFWMKTPSNPAENMVCVSRNRYGGENDILENASSWWVGINTAGNAQFELRDNGGINSVLTGITEIDDNQWHHILAVRNGITNMNILYVDGVQEDSEYKQYNYTFSSDEPDPLPVAVGYLTRKPGDPEYHFTGGLDEIAIYDRMVTASEAALFYNDGNPTSHCSAQNFAPVINSSPSLYASEDALYSYIFRVDDIDSDDTLTLTAELKPSWLNFSWTTGQKTATLSGSPANDDVGTSDVTLRVSDGKIAKSQNFTITVLNEPDLPVIITEPLTVAYEDIEYSYTLIVTDVDSDDNITITAETLPSWLTFDFVPGTKSASIHGIPEKTDTGIYSIALRITDGTNVIHDSYNLTVNPVNDPPVISAQVPLSVNEDQAITIHLTDLTVTDEDNTQNELTLETYPGDSYTVVNNTVTPGLNFNGQIKVNVTVSDLANQSNTFEVLITVLPVNDVPEITSVPETTVSVNDLYVYMLQASDVDNSTLINSVIKKPDWLTFVIANGILTGTPTVNDTGKNEIILRVSDGELYAEQAFNLEVKSGITSVSENQNEHFFLYPVPAHNKINIEFNNLSQETVIDIIDLAGNIIDSDIIPENTTSYSFNIHYLKPGFYIIRIKNKNRNNNLYFTVQK